MLTPKQIMDAAEDILTERFPGETVYRQLAPDGFDRPSFLLCYGPVNMTDGGYGLLELAVSLKITAFINVDGSGGNGMEALLERMAALQELFAVEGMRVGGRVLHVAGSNGECMPDSAQVTIDLQYQDDRPGKQDWPLMGEINIKAQEAPGLPPEHKAGREEADEGREDCPSGQDGQSGLCHNKEEV